MHEALVMLRCMRKGCPRTVHVPMDSTMPQGTVEIRSLCPWHEKSGEFASEYYYDADGNELYPE